MSTDSLSAALRLFNRWERMGKTIGESTLRWLKKAGTLVTQSSYWSLIYPINAPPMPPRPGKLKSVPVLIGKIIGRKKTSPMEKVGSLLRKPANGKLCENDLGSHHKTSSSAASLPSVSFLLHPGSRDTFQVVYVTSNSLAKRYRQRKLHRRYKDV